MFGAACVRSTTTNRPEPDDLATLGLLLFVFLLTMPSILLCFLGNLQRSAKTATNLLQLAPEIGNFLGASGSDLLTRLRTEIETDDRADNRTEKSEDGLSA